MPDPTLQWGILGCARISRTGLIPGIRASTTGRLVAIASRDRAKADAWSAEFAIPRAFGSYDDLIASPEVQAVYIPLPNELHRPWALAAAEAGKHVLCEKPLALDASEAQAIASHCHAHGVILMEAFMWRHQPRTAELRRLIADGAIGELRLIRASFSFLIEPGDWRHDPARGGGSLWDVGCYGVNAARLFADAEPEAVSALAHFGPTRVDLSLSASIRFPSGVLGQVDCSFEQPLRCALELVGSTGAIEVPEAFIYGDRPRARLIKRRRPAPRSGVRARQPIWRDGRRLRRGGSRPARSTPPPRPASPRCAPSTRSWPPRGGGADRPPSDWTPPDRPRTSTLVGPFRLQIEPSPDP